MLKNVIIFSTTSIRLTLVTYFSSKMQRSGHFFDLFANFDFCGNIPQFQIVCFRICESKSHIYLNSNIIQFTRTGQNISPKIYGNAALHNEVAMPDYFLNGLDSSDDTHSATNLLFHADHDSSSFIFSKQIFFSQSAPKLQGFSQFAESRFPGITSIGIHPYHTIPHNTINQSTSPTA